MGIFPGTIHLEIDFIKQVPSVLQSMVQCGVQSIVIRHII